MLIDSIENTAVMNRRQGNNNTQLPSLPIEVVQSVDDQTNRSLICIVVLVNMSDIVLKVLKYSLLSPAGSRANILHLSNNIYFIIHRSKTDQIQLYISVAGLVAHWFF